MTTTISLRGSPLKPHVAIRHRSIRQLFVLKKNQRIILESCEHSHDSKSRASASLGSRPFIFCTSPSSDSSWRDSTNIRIQLNQRRQSACCSLTIVRIFCLTWQLSGVEDSKMVFGYFLKVARASCKRDIYNVASSVESHQGGNNYVSCIKLI